MLTKEDFLDTVDLDCLGTVAGLLEDYDIEQVRACLNYLCSDNHWLSRHRNQHTRRTALDGPLGRHIDVI